MASGVGSSRENKEIYAGKKLSALIINDCETIRLIHEAIFRKYGFETTAVDDGKQAIDLFRSNAYYDLVIMNYGMPTMNGAQATRELRAMGVKSMIVGVTPSMRESEKNEFLEAGVDHFYLIPLKFEVAETLRKELLMKNSSSYQHI